MASIMQMPLAITKCLSWKSSKSSRVGSLVAFQIHRSATRRSRLPPTVCRAHLGDTTGRRPAAFVYWVCIWYLRWAPIECLPKCESKIDAKRGLLASETVRKTTVLKKLRYLTGSCRRELAPRMTVDREINTHLRSRPCRT